MKERMHKEWFLDGRMIVSSNRDHRLLCSWDGSYTLQIWERTWPPTNTGLWVEVSARALQEVPASYNEACSDGNIFIAYYLEHEAEVG